MRIQTLSRLTGASPKALRHYEALGLLGAVPREGRYRRYGPPHLERAQLVRRAQRYGFTLAELGQAAGRGPGVDWAALLHLVQARRLALRAEQQRLAALDAELADIAAELSSCDTVTLPIAPCLPLPVVGA